MAEMIRRPRVWRGLWAAVCVSCLMTVSADAQVSAPTYQEPAVLTLTEAAHLLRVGEGELEQLAERGEVPARRIGSSWRFSRAALMNWLIGDRAPNRLTTPGLAAVTASGTVPSQAGAQAPATPASADSQTKPIGEAPEERTAEDVFLRGQKVLLGRGEVVVDFGEFYARSDDLQLASVNGGVGLAVLEQASLTTILVGRVGIFNETELFASTAVHHLNDRAFVGSTDLASSGRTEFGGVGFGVRRTLLKESAGRPDVIATLHAQIPTGDIPFSAGAGVVFVKSIDPVVLFANANYSHSFSQSFSNLTRVDPEDRFDVSLGYAVGLNDTLAFSTAVSGLFTGATTVGTTTLKQADAFSLRFALTSWLARGLYIEPSVSFGLAGPGDSFAFGVTIPYSF
ncbi:MAG TPA: helix-turn-helix domain-containing protein [Vicinamibacterales bacterium]|nr:helix-turn-helix domain-containing protein [Vicinamibacterales bacterium]